MDDYIRDSFIIAVGAVMVFVLVVGGATAVALLVGS